MPDANGGMFAPLSGDGRRGRQPGAEWEPITPVPEDAPAPPPGHPGRGRPSAVYTYRDAAGAVLCYIYRFDAQNSSKFFLPLTFCRTAGRQEWRWKGLRKGERPLYRLDQLAARPGAQVLITEGEKAADAAVRLLPDLVAVTSPNGAKAAGDADWSPLLGRRVIIWPDADGPGHEYAAAVTRHLQRVRAASIAVIDPPGGVADGWDAADALAEKWPLQRAAALVDAARLISAGEQESDERAGRRRRPASDGLMEIVAGAELWHTPDREPYASIAVAGHTENWPIRGEVFRDWLSGQFYRRNGTAAGEAAVRDALSTMAAQARHDGPEHPVFLRSGAFSADEVYLDHGDKTWRVARVRPGQWDVLIDQPLAKPRRSENMGAVPEAERGGHIGELLDLVNFGSEDQFKLIVAWLIAALNPNIACPILAINGEQGSAKSTLSAVLKNLIDPNTASLRAPPRDEQDLVIAAYNSRVLVLDNVSSIPAWLSDALCRLATGGGFAARKLYSDREEVVFSLMRPIIINGIPDLATRPDLADRCLMISLPAIPEDRRRTDDWIKAELARRHPLILGALLDAVAAGLLRQRDVHLDRLPRMAGFARWVTAAEPGLGWEPGTILAAYERNRAGAVESIIEADPLAAAVRSLMEIRSLWEATTPATLAELTSLVPDTIARSSVWPSVASLKSRLRRLQAPLRSFGIVLDLDARTADHARTRLIRIRRTDQWGA